jgi:Ca2+-binding EF-hand superfamily protein
MRQEDWATAAPATQALATRLVQAAFRHIDLDNNGAISVDDLDNLFFATIPHKVQEVYNKR